MSLLFFGHLSYAQNEVIDSLKNALSATDNSSEQVNTLILLSRQSQNRLEALQYALDAVEKGERDLDRGLALNQVAWSYKNLFQFDSALVNARKSLALMKQTNMDLETSDVYNTFGSIYNNMELNDSAIYYHKKALATREKAEDLQGMAISMNNLSLVYQRLAAFDEAAFYIDQSIEIYEELGLARSAADSYLNKGNLFTNAGSLDSAYANFQQALRTYESLGQQVMMTYALINMGTVAVDLSQIDMAKNDLWRSKQILLSGDQNASLLAYTFNGLGGIYLDHEVNRDSSLFYLEKGLAAASQASSKYLISISKHNLGRVYFKDGAHAKALGYLKDAADLKTEIGDLAGKSLVLASMGMAYGAQGNYKAGDASLEEALEISEELEDLGNRESVHHAWYLYSKEKGDYEQALKSYEAMTVYKDSLLNSKHLSNVSQLNVKYETEQKEQQIALQEASLEAQGVRLQRNQILITGLIVAAGLLAAVLVLLRVRSQKEKALITQEAELKLREAEINAVINSQEKERNRFARDLHDGFGQMISVLKLNLGQLKEVDNRDLEKREEIFHSGEQVINEMYGELRNICFDLMPQTLVKQGLTAALKEFGSRVSQNTGTHCEVMVFDDGSRPSELTEIALFRVTQEWVNNVLKYAEASEVVIQVTQEENELTLTIEDNGQGFDPEQFYKGTGNGWRNIQSRLNQVNASFDLDSRPGVKGSMVTVNIEADSNEAIPTGTETEMTV